MKKEWELISLIVLGWLGFGIGPLAWGFYEGYKLRKICKHKDRMVFRAGGGDGIVQCMDCDKILER